MANNPCPKCSTIRWWWRDETGCSVCVSPADDYANQDNNSLPATPQQTEGTGGKVHSGKDVPNHPGPFR